jgi:hypothetical protein
MTDSNRSGKGDGCLLKGVMRAARIPYKNSLHDL